MPEKKTIERARLDKREGKAATTQAGEFVREEIEHVREGKHGVRNAKQAIAIGLSKARKAGVDIPPPPGRKAATKSSGRPNAKRSRAAFEALQREGPQGASHLAISRLARANARKRAAT
jgi:hypothetical protein